MNIYREQLDLSNNTANMINTFFLCRFDVIIRPDVTAVIKQHICEGSKAEMLRTPGAVVTIFQSYSTLKKINDAMIKLEPEIAYFLFDVTHMPIAINFPTSVASNIGRLLKQNTNVSVQEEEPNFDRDWLLEQINIRGGIQYLTERERKALDRLSQQ